jgi:hypothetical protein
MITVIARISFYVGTWSQEFVLCRICHVVHLAKNEEGFLANWVSSFASLPNLVVFPGRRTCIYSSMSVLWIRIRMGFRRLDPDPGWQNKEKVKKFHVLKCWMSSRVAKGISYSLDFGHPSWKPRDK